MIENGTEVRNERVVVFHEWYGCDSGCCGHQAVLYLGTTEVRRGEFHFEHPYREDKDTFAVEIAARDFPGVFVDLESCEICDD